MIVGENRIRFGVFEVQVDTRELHKFGIRIKLEEQPFSVLMVLLEKPGELVTRAELRARIWPGGTFVDFDKSLTKAINKIRAALDDSAATPRFIETLSRRGYRFIAPVIPGPSQSVPEHAGAPRGRQWRRRAAWAAGGCAVILLTLGGLHLLRVHGGSMRAVAVEPIQSLVVLPIVNLTGDARQEYFVDGLTDDLISDLGRIPSVRVISYTSSMRYKGAALGLTEIARELNVEGVIEGSVQRAGGRLRMNMKLLRAPADRQLWSESYEGEAAEPANLEGTVARAVAHQISAHLTAEATARLTSRRPVNPRAYDAYLHGRYLWNLRGRDAVTQAGVYFEQAVHEDPGFALGWSGLADRYTIGWRAGSDAAAAEQYARKALALDPGLGEAHVSLGFAQLCLHRFADAEKELNRGVELTPNYVAAHQLYAVFLLTVGRPAEALEQSDRALQLDPFSLPVNNMRGLILVGLRQYARAEEAFRAAAEIDPKASDIQYNLARVYWLQRRIAEALVAEQRAARPASELGADEFRLGEADVQAAFAKLGFRAACLRSLRMMRRAGAPDWVIFLRSGLLHDDQLVLRRVGQEAGRTGYADMYLFKTAPELDFIRSDPRFQGLLRQIGLPP